MNQIVLDASAAVEALVSPRGLGGHVRAVLGGCEMHAPELIDTEVLSALARLERAGTLTRAGATEAVSFWEVLPINRYGGPGLIREVWRTRGSLRISDAFYLALARGMGIPLLTCDGRLARAPHPGVTVTLIS